MTRPPLDFDAMIEHDRAAIRGMQDVPEHLRGVADAALEACAKARGMTPAEYVAAVLPGYLLGAS